MITLFLFITSLFGSDSVLVTLTPYKSVVEQLACGTVKVEVLVPGSANMHSFEPTPKQMVAHSNAIIWFRMGEPFEERVLLALQSYRQNLVVIDLRDEINLLGGHGRSADLHYWLSPKVVRKQAEQISRALQKQFPENIHLYQTCLKKYLRELDNLIDEVETVLTPLKNRTIFVSHHAYNYFCRDFNMKQFSVEFEGRATTSKQLERLVDAAKSENARTIFLQTQFNNKGAILLAEQIGAKTVMIDPFQENYIHMMRGIASKFSAK